LARCRWLPFGSKWIFPTSESIEQSRPTRCPKEVALLRVQLSAPLAFEVHLCIAFSDTLSRQYADQARLLPRLTPHLPISLQPCSSPLTAHPDRWVTIELLVLTYGMLLAGSLLCRERLALSRTHPASSTEGRGSRQSAPSAARCAVSEHYWPPFQLAGRGHPGPALRNFC
jgi:hypothetical protein